MAELKGSETEKNLLTAFSGESEAASKYTVYAMKAKQEGHEYISKIFEETADNEKEHAKIWFKWLKDGKIPTTLENLENSIEGESYESDDMYLNFSSKAREEGFDHIADLFTYVAQIEKRHEERFRKLVLTLKNDAAPNKCGNYLFECSVCGCVIEQKEVPSYCPLCQNEDVFFFKIDS